MSIQNTFSKGTIGILIAAGLGLTLSAPPAHSGGAGAFIGGVMAAKVGQNMRRRTEAEEEQAYNSQRAAQPVQQAAPAPAPAAQTPEQKINQLDKLAAGGYITPEEYKAKKKAILDSM
jgi:membrane protease subunit (stomatin/prohibitin family)